ncbi:MAG TPA: class I SAM-dependent methyltransferase [Candidatus Coprenecus stercoravium]|uniref:Class I SAM-dependent methyltransferase n=1 Tax=Candidatus Coprenecus stercoravium TaxID=2840735 RepID=A0A9D2GRK2_9BACT|nr:class I SAM-dependent methyltransferase [Candidatus Coprenecus stercoravium]
MDAATLDKALQYIERETHLRTKSYRMLSDGIQGGFLQAFSLMVKPQAILEIGTFTGYATLCLYRGLKEDGILDTLEKDDEMTDIFTTAFSMAGADRIRSRIGDAKAIIPTLNRTYDIVYIDADKREYPLYYDLVFDKVRPGGYILADNVLWSGKTTAPVSSGDRQTAAIMEFNKKTASDPRVEKLVLPIRDGLALMRIKG